jgi:hypothetical protein
MDALKRSGGGTPLIKQQSTSNDTTVKGKVIEPVITPEIKKPGDEITAPVTEGKVKLTSKGATEAQAPVTGSRVSGDWLTGGGSKARALFDQAVKDLKPTGTPTTAPPPGTTTKPITGADVSLIGLPSSFFDPKASYEENLARLQEQGIPRFANLSETERTHETKFATEVQANPEFYVGAAEVLAKDDRLNAHVFEVDAMKRLFEPYGKGGKPANDTERTVRAESNHALHPTAVAVARLAFLKKLDEMAQLPDGDPKKQVFVTSGGCAAGKGSLSDIVKRQLGNIPFGAVWDAAGEGDAKENKWVLDACQARGIKTVFGFAANDATQKYKDVLERGAISGRIVDVVTFANSYVEGTKQMNAFLQSPEFQEALKSGTTNAVGVFTGRFDVASLKNPELPAYPDLRTLGQDGLIKAGDLPKTPDTAGVIEAALAELQRFVAARKEAGQNTDMVVGASLGLALKFQSEIS